ncbi:hypothetical protein GE061_002015 [Apolygus lucorum]|uniref:Carboxylesterase type B domain-containing protein n=1 Tax=Apolygus lucorum TaxID=248454 RepID=A0A6A4JKB1_APOLU|nr:hypothetical protein GE061_002015 [Apolygus lucorum]
MRSGVSRLLLLVSQLFFVICSPEVSLPVGRVRGIFQETINGRRIRSFLGIPYAEPPIGSLRFKEPKPFRAWDDVLNATSPPNKCLQSNKRGVGKEDCLYLNVHTPEVS